MRNRYMVPSVLAAAALALAACSTSEPAQEQAQPTSDLSTQQVNDQCGTMASNLSPWPGDLDKPEAIHAGALMCGDLERGRDLNSLRQPESIAWNEQCLSREGYTLDHYGDGTPKLRSANPDRFTPQDVAECGTPKFSPEQCEDIANGLGAASTGDRDGKSMSAEEAAVLNSLGCDVPEAFPSDRGQAGISEARTAGTAELSHS